MAASALTIQAPSLTVTTPTLNAANVDGNWVAPGTNYKPIYLWIVNASGGAITVTMNDPTSVTPVAPVAWDPDVAWVVGAGTTRVVKIDPVSRFLDTATGKISITYSGVTTLTVAVLQ